MSSNQMDGYHYCPRCGSTLVSRVVKDEEAPRPVCPACSFVAYLDPRLAAGTIFVAEGGIVLLRRAVEPGRGKWVFPGGYVDRGEVVADAAVRETFEETGARVVITGILDVYSYAGQDVAVVVYAAEIVQGIPEAPHEAAAEVLELRRFPPESIPWDDLAFETTRAALRDYVRRFYPRARIPR